MSPFSEFVLLVCAVLLVVLVVNAVTPSGGHPGF